MTNDIKQATIYRNALLKSVALQYLAFFLIFCLAPLAFLFGFFKIMKDSEFTFNAVNTVITICILILFLFLFGIFTWLRKYWVNRIVIDVERITFYGFFKRVQSYWQDVLSLESHTALFGNKMGKVSTKTGTFLFPYTMKEENEEYPKLLLTLDDWKWIDENGTEEKAELVNCPLFVCIQKKLNVDSGNKERHKDGGHNNCLQPDT